MAFLSAVVVIGVAGLILGLIVVGVLMMVIGGIRALWKAYDNGSWEPEKRA